MGLASLLLPAPAASDSVTSPITFTEIKAANANPLAAPPSQLVSTIGFASYDPSTNKLVSYEDKAPFGASKSGTAWLLRGEIDLGVEGSQVVRYPLNVLLDSVNERLVAAFTDVNPVWVSPVLPSRGLDYIVAENGWDMGLEIPGDLQSSVRDAIEETLRLEELDARATGQIVVRPRWITPRFPAQLVDDKLVPMRPTTKVWIVQICGTKTGDVSTSAGNQYYSGKVVQLIDGSLEFAWAFYVP